MNTKLRIARKLYREFEIEVDKRQAEEEGGDDRFEISFSSELPVKRWSWDDGPYYEVLSHAPGDVDLSRATRGLPALKSHARLLHFGSVNPVWLDDVARKLRGLLGFSSIALGREQKTLVDEGHLRTVSVGYEIKSMRLLSTDWDEPEEETGIPTYLCKWMPFEVSTEPIPADMEVGFGRHNEGNEVELNLAEFVVDGPADGGEQRMGNEAIDGKGVIATSEEKPVVRVTQDAANSRDAQTAEIMEMCVANKMAERAAEWIRDGLTPDQVSRKILADVSTRGIGQPPAERVIDLPKSDRQPYSLQRALRIGAGMEKMDGIEAEMHTELGRDRAGSDHGGIRIPLRERALGTGEATGGATLVGEQRMPDLIDLLRNKSRCLEAGARLYTGLVGNVQFTKKTGAPTVHWMQENPATAAAQSEPTYGYLELTPKTQIGTVQVPRQLLVQSSIDVEADIKRDLAIGTGTALDLAALHGSGVANQPVGIYTAADVQAKAFGGVPTLATVSAMTGLVADANADFGALSFMTTPLCAELCTRTEKASGYPVYLWDGTLQNGTMLGYPARATNQISKTLEAAAKHGFIFGNWNDLLIGMWGNDLEVVVDTVTRAAYSQIVLTSYAMADTGIRRGPSFVKATGCTIV
jgi:HK97 family phage major capsid protein